MTQGLIVRLADGSEIGPLGRDDLRSWFEGGLISADSMVKRPDAARWTTLGQEIDVTLWRQLAGTARASAARADAAPRPAASPRPAAPRPAAASPRPRATPDTAPRAVARAAERASWELPGWVKWVALAAVLVAVGAGAWRYFTTETETQKRLRAAALPERRFADADAGVALDLPAGWLIVRAEDSGIAAPAQARVLLAEPSSTTTGYLLSEAPGRPYASLDEYVGRVIEDRRKSQGGYQEGTRTDGSVGPFPARFATASWRAGEDAFRERIAVWKEAWTYFALVTWTPQAREARGARAAEGLARGFSSVGQVGQRVQAALQRVITEVPHLSTRSAETLMGRSAAGVLEPPEVFRRSWDLASRGLFALSKAESRELSTLTSAVYARVPGPQRARLGAYVSRVRERETTTTEQDAEMCGIMKAAVDKLPALSRARLQELFDKAIASGLTRAS
jgi:hypothetical protein